MSASKILLAISLMTVIGFVAATPAIANIINITPSKDNTLYEYDAAEGDHSNGAGLHFFAGENAMGELRRGVLAFNVAAVIPAGSTITAVTLTLNMSMGERSGQQLWLVGAGRRNNYRNSEAFRYSRERQPAYADYSIHTWTTSYANSPASPQSSAAARLSQSSTQCSRGI